MQKRRHLEASFQQTDPGCSSDSQPHAFLISGPASPGNKKLYFFKPYFMCNVVKVSDRPGFKYIYELPYGAGT